MSPAETPYARLGELIDHLLHMLIVAKRGWRMGRAVDHVARRTGYTESTVYRWREGRLRPPDDTLEKLARLGKEDARLERPWGDEILHTARHPDADLLINEIWGTQHLRVIPNNLPPPTYTTFFGRQNETARLLELLSPHHAAHLISIDGIGGVGKTALVLEVAYRCLRASTGEALNPRVPMFDAIIFVSAKQEVLTPGGILERTHTQRTLQDIFREIARTLDRTGIMRVVSEEQLPYVREALADQNTLLIVDNMETVEDKQGIIAFLYDLPPQIKVVITTREQALFAPIRLESLSKGESLQLIRQEASEKCIAASDEHALVLYQKTGGVPVALIYAVGHLAAGYSLDTVLTRLSTSSGDIARYCFESSVAPLRDQAAHRLLMAMAMFPRSPLRDAVAYSAGLGTDPIGVDESFALLNRLSLVKQQNDRFNMLPLTREFALAELRAHPDHKQEARELWVKWYLNFTMQYGGEDWQEWHIRYDHLEDEWENLRAVFDWCAAQDRYKDIRLFWQDEHVNDFANIYGYWDDRLTWVGWLLNAAERRGDWETAISAMSKKGFTYCLMAQPQRLVEADHILTRAWDMRENASPITRKWIANHTSTLRIRQGRYEEANQWCDIAEQVLLEIGLEEPNYSREWITVAYYRAIISYETGDYERAAHVFRQVMERAEQIEWQRAAIYAQNGLADAVMFQGELDAAERLLKTGITVAELYKDKRRASFYNRSFAHLERAKGQLPTARQWASKALDGFDRLGMHPEAEEMRQLLQLLDAGQE